MTAPTLSSSSPTTVVAGAAPVTLTLTGANFATGIVVSSVTPGIHITSSAYVDSSHCTCKIAADPGMTRGQISLTLTNLDAGTVTDTTHGPKVVSAAVTSGALDQYPANPIPGATPGTTGEAVASKSETTHQLGNPAFDPANETGVKSQQGSDASFPGIVTPHGGEDQDLTAVNRQEDLRDIESVPTDHSPQLPLAPTTVTASSGSAGHATVNWLAPAANTDPGYAVTGYTITATSSDGGTSPVALTVGAVLTGTVAGLTTAKHYTFTVHATNAAGSGPESAASSSLLIT